MANERLAQYNTFQENHLGFKGIIAGVADELIPDGYVPDMENLKITIEGIAEPVVNPQSISPPAYQGTSATTAITSMFVWRQDNNTNVLLAQYGARLFYKSGSDWLEPSKAGTTLASAVADTIGTTITVTAASNISMPFSILIDSEKMTVVSGGATTTWTVTRGAEGSVAATHLINTVIYMPALDSMEKASYASGMQDELYIVNKDTQCMKLTDTFTLTTLWNGPKGKYITLWKNRLFIGGVTAFYGLALTTTSHGAAQTLPFGALSSAVIWSNIGLADDQHGGTSHDNGWYAGSIIALRTPENSVCTGLLPVQENLLMFTKSAIFSFSGYSDRKSVV